MTQDGDESVWAFGMRFQKISDVLMKKGKISEVERCTIFIGHLSKGRQKSILRDLPRDRLDFPEVLKLAIKAEADDYKDLVWREMRRRDFSLYKEYATDRCPDFKDYPWSEKNEAVAEEVKEIRDMVKGLTRQVTEIVTATGATAYRDKPGGPYSLRWDRRNNDPWRSVEDRNPRTLTDYHTRGRERDDEPWRRRDDEIDRDRRDREPFVQARRLDDYPRSPPYEADRGRGDSRGRWETGQSRRDGYRDDRYERSDRDGYRDDRYEKSGRDGYRGSRYERGDREWERQDGSRERFERGEDAREHRDESRGWYNRGDRRDESRGDITRGTAGMIREGGMTKEGLEETGATIRAVGMRERDMTSHQNHIPSRLTPRRPGVRSLEAQTTRQQLRGTHASTVEEKIISRGIARTLNKDGQRIDGEEVILSPRKRGVKKFLMKSSLDEIDTVEPLRRALRQPMQCSILEYLAASKPARDELQMITRKTRIPLSEEGHAPKAEASTVTVTGVTARADRMATVLLDGMEGVSLDKFYILGSRAVETIINEEAVLDAVIDNDNEAVIIDEDLAVQVGLGLDRSYLFEIETADGRKQQITGVCHKAVIEVQGVRVTLPVFAVKNCSSDLLLGRTWLSHVHAVTIERPDGSQTLCIKKPDGTRVMIETVEPRDPRNRAALAVGARASDQIKSLPISCRAVRFREKKYGPLLTEEEGRIVEVEDLGSRLIVNGNSYPKEKDEEFGGPCLF
ncbi:hypothetical protein CBR_g57926 [Chara braunii]|uniref:Uncharacterized protein n=1 Tax=Chara braunii TaxID=69332 RepID=A0A388MEH2_CHABU|nr:hypothetical protein CBR_g57926 [Chara braunii]|eukprot:GBG92957.1 hypothetical protein CBR_g57926 [Chara braunii]